MKMQRSGLLSGKSWIILLISSISLFTVWSVITLPQEVSSKELRFLTIRIGWYMRNEQLEKARDLAVGLESVTRDRWYNSRIYTSRDSVSFSYLYPHLGYIFDSFGNTRTALRYYRLGGVYMSLRTDTIQVLLLRWAATLAADEGKITLARTYALRSKRLAHSRRFFEAEADTDSCLLAIPEPRERTYFAHLFLFGLGILFASLLPFTVPLLIRLRIVKEWPQQSLPHPQSLPRHRPLP